MTTRGHLSDTKRGLAEVFRCAVRTCGAVEHDVVGHDIGGRAPSLVTGAVPEAVVAVYIYIIYVSMSIHLYQIYTYVRSSRA
jgi:hypothetical protein